MLDKKDIVLIISVNDHVQVQKRVLIYYLHGKADNTFKLLRIDVDPYILVMPPHRHTGMLPSEVIVILSRRVF